MNNKVMAVVTGICLVTIFTVHAFGAEWAITKDGFPVCNSSDNLWNFLRLYNAGDGEAALKYVLSGKCTPSRPGMKVEILDRQLSRKFTKIRFKGETSSYWISDVGLEESQK